MIRILIILLLTSTCFAGEDFLGHETGAAIHTYGGGPLLEKVFNAIAMILYGDAQTGIGKAFNAIVRLSLAVGGFCCVCVAFFREKFDPLFKTFFLPAVGIVSCLLIPRTSVLIVDHIGQKTPSAVVWGAKKVNNVPFFLGKFATLVSEVSYRLERLFTDRAHDPKDKMYDWTGNIYAGENIFRAKKCRITNPILEDDFREFSRECVFRDIGIGLYTKEELIRTPNILKFLEENTSNMRTVFYKDPFQESPIRSECLTCKEAMKKMNLLFNGKEANAKEIVFGEIGNQVHFLLGQKELGEKDLKNLIKQQIAIDILKEELPGSLNSFAAKRAEILQKENQKILGALGASSLVAMRNFFEATIYMVFPLVLIVALLSFGVQAIIQWIQFVLWVNTWPLFYIVVNFLLNSIWDVRKQAILGDSPHLTLFSSEGLSDLYSSMESIAAIALAFIPYLSWILLKGGVSQMVHLASSIMSPAQSAASTAAAEKTSGNYSFGNISLDSTSGYNAQMFRQTYSGMLSHDSVGIDTGSQNMTYTPRDGGIYLKQGDSYLREGISKTEAFNSSLQKSLSHSESAVHESSKAVSESITDSANKGVGFVNAISRHWQTGENASLQGSTSVQDAFQYIKNISEEYASSKGIGQDAAIREVLSAGIGGKVWGIRGDAQVSMQDGVSKFLSESSNERTGESDSLQRHLQTITNLSAGEVASLLGSEDAKLHQDFTQSLNKTDSAADQWRAAHSQHEALSKIQNYAESDTLSLHQNMNQQFVDFLNAKFEGDPGRVIDATELHNNNPEKRALIDEFVKEYLPNQLPEVDISSAHKKYNAEVESKAPKDQFERRKANFIETHQPKVGHEFQEQQSEYSHMKSRIATQKEDMKQDLESQPDQISDREVAMKGQFDPDKSLLVHAKDELVSAKVGAKLFKAGGNAIYNVLFAIGESILKEE